MTTLIASDLDRTLIYSREARGLGDDPVELVCVEEHDGEQISFMTGAAAAELTALVAQVTFVPVTTRILSQYRRVNLPGRVPSYAAVANGGVLLVDGVADRVWSERVAVGLRDSLPLADVWDYAGRVCRPEFTEKLRNADGLFCYAVVRPDHLPPSFVEDVAGWAAELGWSVSLQGRKLYWVPRSLTKGAAVAEVAQRVGASRVLAAGDSLLDVDLLLGADLGIHPRHGELHDQGWSAPTVVGTASSGVRAGEEIVRWLAGKASAVHQTGMRVAPLSDRSASSTDRRARGWT